MTKTRRALLMLLALALLKWPVDATLAVMLPVMALIHVYILCAHKTLGAWQFGNRYLVDNADLLLAAYDGQPGGTQMTCEYAKKVGVDVCKIPPVVEKPKKTVPAATDEDDKEVEDLLRGSVVLFKEVQQIKPVPGKTYSVDCPFCNAADSMDFSLSTLNNHLHARCSVCMAAVMQ